MRKLKSRSDSKKHLKILAKAKGIKVEEIKNGKKVTLWGNIFASMREAQPPKHKPWQNKKQMKAYKKLRTKFLQERHIYESK